MTLAMHSRDRAGAEFFRIRGFQPARMLDILDPVMSELPDVTIRLVAALEGAKIEFTLTEHRPVYSSAEAADVRGTSLHSGAKALIVKSDRGYSMLVMPADLALDSSATRKHFRSKRLRFASKDELLELTGLTPGSVPPFGSLFVLPTICDERLEENGEINFNAGDQSRSIRMSYRDYVAFEKPEIARVAKES